MIRRAMTMVELVIVIGVIALLIGLLAPGLWGVRAAGRAMRRFTWGTLRLELFRALRSGLRPHTRSGTAAPE